MVLNDQNKAQVQTIVTQAMTNRRLIEIMEDELRKLCASLDWNENFLREAQREQDRYNQEIQALGFHDIGHARTELGK